MSRKQWGHGYYQGLEESKKQTTPLAGCAFITEKEFQGTVREKISEDLFKVTFFSALTGLPYKDKLVSLDEMKGWDFYPNCTAMRMAMYRQKEYSEEDIEWAERCQEFLFD